MNSFATWPLMRECSTTTKAHLYKEAEAKQWGEHLKYNTIKILPAKVASEVRKRVSKERILRARFAYPDLRTGQLNTEAPTATKVSITCLVFVTIHMMGWSLAAGDIGAAFLNGVEARRDLYNELD